MNKISMREEIKKTTEALPPQQDLIQDNYVPILSASMAACARMEAEGLPTPVIKNFKRLYDQVCGGETGVIEEHSIEPVGCVDTLESVRDQDVYHSMGMAKLEQLAVIRLNGGLGSSMGMPNAKSLLPIRDGLSFNDLTIKQLQSLREETGFDIPLIHMTSFRTDSDIQRVMNDAGYENPKGLPTTFTQHKHPKIYLDTLEPASESDDALNWNPPGHGDIYAALLATGIAMQLLQAGKRYLFVANADNLGATVAPEILGYMAYHHCPFLMETCKRTEADKKGGHLARDKQTGQLLLREVAQAPQEDGEVIPAFSDIERYNQFNTNSIWLDLAHVIRMAELYDDCIPLPLIRNVKPVDTEDRSSRPVIQIETAMGAAINLFSGARALEVPRERFMPVKTNNDLLLVMSDWYEVTHDGRLVPHESTKGRPAPSISLDPKYYGMINDFSRRVQVCPSLREASALTVIGDWEFRDPMTISGSVTLSSVDEQSSIRQSVPTHKKAARH